MVLTIEAKPRVLICRGRIIFIDKNSVVTTGKEEELESNKFYSYLYALVYISKELNI